MIRVRSHCSFGMQPDYNELYSVVLQKRLHSQFLNETIRRNSESLSINMIDIQRIARQNSILTCLANDARSISDIIPIKSIFESFQDNIRYFYSFVNDPQLLQNVGFYIRGAYKRPKDFANATLSYFREDDKEYNFFASVLFPSISGYFIGEEHLTFAYEYLNYLIQLGEIKFVAPLVVSFFASSYLFIERFWQRFFAFVMEIRTKPSIKQLYDILIASLQSAIRYLSPFHTALSMDLLTSDPECFCETFFLKVLLDSFDTYAATNPSISTSRVQRNQILQLFSFLCNNTQTKSFEAISNTFIECVSSLCEPTSFVEYTLKGAIPYIFSPTETILIVNIFKKMTGFEAHKIDLTKMKNYCKVNPFTPGIIDVYFAIPNSMPITAVLFSDENIPVTEPSKETTRNWLSLCKMCKAESLDALTVIMENNNEYFDTPKKMMIKNMAQNMMSEELRKYAVETTLSSLISSEQAFETCLVRFAQKQRLLDISDSQKRFGTILNRSIAKKMTFLPADCPRTILLPSLAIDAVEVEENQKLYDLLEMKEVFDRVARKITRKEARYKAFVKNNEDKLTNYAKVLNNLDEKSLGERLWVIAEVVMNLEKICQSDDWLMTLFFFVIARSNSTCFLHTYMGINAFKALQQARFAQLPRWMQDSWAKLSKQIDMLLRKKQLFHEEFIEKYNMFVK